jgi:hypothetical protein
VLRAEFGLVSPPEIKIDYRYARGEVAADVVHVVISNSHFCTRHG